MFIPYLFVIQYILLCAVATNTSKYKVIVLLRCTVATERAKYVRSIHVLVVTGGSYYFEVQARRRVFNVIVPTVFPHLGFTGWFSHHKFFSSRTVATENKGIDSQITDYN